jgi:hypothetical protein
VSSSDNVNRLLILVEKNKELEKMNQEKIIKIIRKFVIFD